MDIDTEREIPDDVTDATIVAIYAESKAIWARGRAENIARAVIDAWKAHSNPSPLPQCESTWWDRTISDSVQCGYPTGHDGLHGFMGTPYPGNPDTLPMFTWGNEDTNHDPRL